MSRLALVFISTLWASNILADQPSPILRVEAKYPVNQMRYGNEGCAVAQFDIADGTVSNIRVVFGNPNEGFADETKKALKKWKYSPNANYKNANIAFTFSLSDSGSQAGKPCTDYLSQVSHFGKKDKNITFLEMREYPAQEGYDQALNYFYPSVNNDMIGVALGIINSTGRLGHPSGNLLYALVLMNGIQFDDGEFEPATGLILDEAKQRFALSLKANYPEAKYFKAEMLLEGIHYEKDVKGGLSLLESASESGSLAAKKALAQVYAEGLYGVSKNIIRANQLIEEAIAMPLPQETKVFSGLRERLFDGEIKNIIALRYTLENKDLYALKEMFLPVTLRGVAAMGQGYANKEVCIKAMVSTVSWETMKTLARCVMTDDKGNYFLDNLEDLFGGSEDVPLLIQLKTEGEPGIESSNDEFLYSINDQTELNDKVSNINELTDAITDTFFGTNIDSAKSANECWKDLECLLETPRVLKESKDAIDDIEQRFKDMFNGLIEKGRDILHGPFITDPSEDPLDALIENIDVEVVDGSDEITLYAANGDIISVYDLDDYGVGDNKLLKREMAAIFEGAGGDPKQEETASTYILCNKKADSPNGRTSIANMCMPSKQQCIDAGGSPSKFFHKNQSACQRQCWEINEKITPVKGDGSSPAGFESTDCLTDLETFTARNIYSRLDPSEACQLGSEEACDEMKYSQELGKTFLLTSTESDPSGKSIRFDWSTIENARGYRLYQTSKNGVPEKRLQKRVDANEGEGLNKITWNGNGYYQPDTRYCFVVETFNDAYTTTSEELCTETTVIDEDKLSEVAVTPKPQSGSSRIKNAKQCVFDIDESTIQSIDIRGRRVKVAHAISPVTPGKYYGRKSGGGRYSFYIQLKDNRRGSENAPDEQRFAYQPFTWFVLFKQNEPDYLDCDGNRARILLKKDNGSTSAIYTAKRPDSQFCPFGIGYSCKPD